MKLIFKLKHNRKPVSITFARSETYKLTAHFLIEIDLSTNKAVILNVFTRQITKFNDRGFYHLDQKVIKRIKENAKLKCVD